MNFLKRFVKGKTVMKKQSDGSLAERPAKARGNVAIAQVDIPGVEPTLKAWSSEDFTPDSFLPITKSPDFKTYKIDSHGDFGTNKSWDRIKDTEARILIHISERLKSNPNASGTIVLHTFYSPCESCRGIIKKLTKMHPNIKIIITWDKH